VKSNEDYDIGFLVWKGILAVAVIMLVAVMFMIFRSTSLIVMRHADVSTTPPEEPPQQVAAVTKPRATPSPPLVSAPAPRPVRAPAPVPVARPVESGIPPASAPNLSVVEMDELLDRQARNIEREKLQNEGTDNKLVPSEEEIRAMKEKQAIIL